MQSVYKYDIIPDKEDFPFSTITLPIGANILSIKEQNGNMVLYALVNPDNVSVNEHLVIIPTGYKISKEIEDSLGDFIDTVIINGLVYHVFHAK